MPNRVFPFEPMPNGCAQNEAASIVRQYFSGEHAQSIIALLRPSLRIWSRPSARGRVESRFGGLPDVPKHWSWPIEDEKPLVFLGQIDCAAVLAEAGESELPENGVISFFGGHEDIEGCGPTYGGAVFYFGDAGSLKPAAAPAEDYQPLITCGLSFYRHWEAPHPWSKAIGALGFSKEELQTYWDAYTATAHYGVTGSVMEMEISKLLGWPNLVQCDLNEGIYKSKDSETPGLLLQIGWYRDGDTFEGWGPGGILYFVLGLDDLASKRFSAAQLEVQTT